MSDTSRGRASRGPFCPPCSGRGLGLEARPGIGLPASWLWAGRRPSFAHRPPSPPPSRVLGDRPFGEAGAVQATVAAKPDAGPLRDKMTGHFTVPVGRADARRGWQLPHGHPQPCLLRLAESGGTSGLLENQRCWTALAEGGSPPANCVWVPFQLFRRPCCPALCQ